MKSLSYLFLFFILGTCFISCRTQYIPLTTTKTEYRIRDSLRYDSIYERDSIFLYQKGETIYKYKNKYIYRYLTINRGDTMIRIDTIRVPYPVEKELSRWQIVKLELGGWLLGIVILMIGFVAKRVVDKKR